MLRRVLAFAALLLSLAAPAPAAQQLINIGTSPNDGAGDSLRTAFGKVNSNTSELYAALPGKQPLSAILTGLTGLSLGADQAIYAIGPSTFATTPLPGYGRSLIAAASATAARAALNLGGAAVLNVGTTTGTVADGGALTAEIARATAAEATKAAKGANADISSLSGLTTPIPQSGGGTGYASVSAALDGLFSATQGAILYRGPAGWGALAPNTAGYVLATGGAGANPSWVAVGGATAVLYTAQTLTGSQQDQARANLSGPVSSAPSSSVTLATTDIDRPLFPTGSPTITMPNGGSGWRSGPIRNSNTASGTVALAVPSGATLDGVTNGTTTLWPYQRARIVQTGATAYVTDWIERRALLATRSLTSTTLSSDFTVPVGFPRVTLVFTGARVASVGASIGALFSDDGGATFKSGSTDYSHNQIVAENNSIGDGNFNGSYLLLAFNMNTGFDAAGTLEIDPGGGGRIPQYLSRFFVPVNGVGGSQRFVGGGCGSISTNRLTTVRVNTTGGGFTAQSIALWGEPG